MQTYLISYDLTNHDREEYQKVFKYIKSYGTWAHITESLWAVRTYKNSVQIRNELQQQVAFESAIFVIKSGIESAWSNVICRSEWLKGNL